MIIPSIRIVINGEQITAIVEDLNKNTNEFDTYDLSYESFVEFAITALTNNASKNAYSSASVIDNNDENTLTFNYHVTDEAKGQANDIIMVIDKDSKILDNRVVLDGEERDLSVEEVLKETVDQIRQKNEKKKESKLDLFVLKTMGAAKHIQEKISNMSPEEYAKKVIVGGVAITLIGGAIIGITEVDTRVVDVPEVEQKGTIETTEQSPIGYSTPSYDDYFTDPSQEQEDTEFKHKPEESMFIEKTGPNSPEGGPTDFDYNPADITSQTESVSSEPIIPVEQQALAQFQAEMEAIEKNENTEYTAKPEQSMFIEKTSSSSHK